MKIGRLKNDCCGCNACGDVCPCGAISYKADKEGFWYPVVDESSCINCGQCEDVCPVISQADFIKRYDKPKVYAAYTKEDAIRLDSTSGGVHSMLANKMFDKNAFVGGAVYNQDHTVSQIITDQRERLQEIRSSKYLQSDASSIYRAISERLNEGRDVFFCGTPCQVQALYKFLGKDYDNLITADFICRGVNSPKVFLSYMGLGLGTTNASLGQSISLYTSFMKGYPHLFWIPVGLLAIISISLYIVGQKLADAADPRTHM